MKAPSPDDLFEMVDTIARDTIRERRRTEERAEEKRVLYVACTRARDHLLLSGLHEAAGETEEPTMTDLEEPDPESASSWRDWVQPELLTEDVCTALDSETHIQRMYGDGAYTVSLPTPPTEQVQPDPEIDPNVELSSRPPKPDVSFRFSATDLASLYGEYGELQFNEDTGTIYVEEIDDSETSPESRNDEQDPTTGEAESDSRSTEETSIETDGVDPSVFGEMVHRLCELRPPETHWPHLMEQTLVDEGTTISLSPELQNRVNTHAQRGIDYVDEQTTDVDVEHQYDELYVTAEFERGEISGFIDHLIITSDAYHIIDYKTGDVTPEELEADAEYHENQMKAYAIALNQQETGRSVRVSLVFTTLDDAWEGEWSPDKIESIRKGIGKEIWGQSESIER
jgi:ATP-dependent helicase/nuclease subunit A